MKIDKKFIASIAISVIFILLAVSKVDFAETWKSMRQANYAYVIPSAAAVIASLFIRAIRWKLLLGPIKVIPIRSLFAATMIGAMGNNVLPARLGEVVRADAIGRREKVSRSASFATIIVERTIDLFTVLLFLGVVLIFAPLPQHIERGGYTMLAISVAALGFLLFLRVKTGTAMKLLRLACRPLSLRMQSRVERMMTSFVSGLEILTRGRHMPAIAALSVLIWGSLTSSILFMFMAFGLNQHIDAAVVVLVATAFGVMIPAAPGFVGTYHVSCQLALAIYGVDRASALGFSIVLHITQWAPVTALGIVYFMTSSVSLKEIERVDAST
jgi:uncharacterized protein (TIRG00374 family)